MPCRGTSAPHVVIWRIAWRGRAKGGGVYHIPSETRAYTYNNTSPELPSRRVSESHPATCRPRSSLSAKLPPTSLRPSLISYITPLRIFAKLNRWSTVNSAMEGLHNILNMPSPTHSLQYMYGDTDQYRDRTASESHSSVNSPVSSAQLAESNTWPRR
jgi:hypothetical protein